MAARSRLSFVLMTGIATLALAVPCVRGATVDPVSTRKALVGAAKALLDEAQISYVYGGYQVGDGDECRRCNDCLTTKAPSPKMRLSACPVCRSCSIDCSHFTELVFRQAGLPYPYLDTATMLRSSAATLRRNYRLVDLGSDAGLAQPGDLLVYDGHVVLLERTHRPEVGLARHRGDVVHATGGKDIRRPGEGIQRERFIDIAAFRGPLLRILRHVDLAGGLLSTKADKSSSPGLATAAPTPAALPAKQAGAAAPRLRAVKKRQPNGD